MVYIRTNGVTRIWNSLSSLFASPASYLPARAAVSSGCLQKVNVDLPLRPPDAAFRVVAAFPVNPQNIAPASSSHARPPQLLSGRCRQCFASE